MWILWAGVLLCSSSYTMSVPFLPLFLLELGVEHDHANLWAGIVYSSSFFVSAIMAPLWGSLADKYGRRKMVIRAGICLAVVYALLSVVQTPWQLVVVRMLHGLMGGFVPASMAIVAAIAPKNQTGWGLGMMQAGTMTGGILGPMFGGVLSTLFGMRMSFVVSAATVFMAAVAVICWVKDEQKEQEAAKKQTSGDFKAALHNSRLLQMLALLLILQISLNMVQPLLTLHIANLQGKIEGAVLSSGIILSLVGIAGIIASPLWGKAGGKYGYTRVLAICLLFSGIFAAMQYTVHHLWIFSALQFIFGLFVAGIAPSASTVVVQNTPDNFRGRAIGLTTSANHMGSMIGPLIGGMLGTFTSIHWIFALSGLLLIISGVVVPYLSRRTNARYSGNKIKESGLERDV